VKVGAGCHQLPPNPGENEQSLRPGQPAGEDQNNFLVGQAERLSKVCPDSGRYGSEP
jgi:hypothetical protein